MNKAMLVERMAKMSKESKAVTKRCLEAFIDVVGEELKKKRQVALTGFGTFSVMKRKPRVGVNPSNRQKNANPWEKCS